MSDHGTFSVRVVDDYGRGVSGARVAYQCGTMSGVGEAYTDSDGWAEFDIIHGIIGGAIYVERIWVNGIEVSSSGFYPEDGDTLSFTLP